MYCLLYVFNLLSIYLFWFLILVRLYEILFTATHLVRPWNFVKIFYLIIYHYNPERKIVESPMPK